MGRRAAGRTTIITVIALVLVLSGTVIGQEIDLPFDYFYGRWVDGHQPGFEFDWQKGKRPERQGYYSYTSGNYMFGATDIRGELVSYDGDGHLEFPTFFFRVRPRSNWQLSVDAVTYDAVDDNRDSHGISESRWSQAFDGIVSSHWMNRDNATIEARHAAFSYLVNPVPKAGTFRMDNTLHFNLETFQSNGWYDSADRSSYQDRSNDQSRLDLYSDMSWACSDWLHARASVTGRYGEELWIQSRSIWMGQGSTSTFSTGRRFQRLNVDYRLEAQIVSLAPIYGVLALDQSFEESDTHMWSTRFDVQDRMDIREDRTDQDLFGETATSYSIGLHYVGTGEFDPRVVRDDYSGYVNPALQPRSAATGQTLPGFYDRMMARRQLWIHSQFSHNSRDFFGEGHARTMTYRLAARYGLSGKIQLAVNWNYEHLKYPTSGGFHRDGSIYEGGFYYSVASAVELGLKIRSFEYQPDTGPGWDRDTPEDIAFGPMLQAGMWQAEVVFEPPALIRSSDDRISFGSLSGLENSHLSSLSFSADLGIGRGFRMNIYDTERFLSSEPQSRKFGGSVTARVEGNFQLALSILRSGSRRYDWRNNAYQSSDWRYSDPIISLNVRALL